MIFENSIQQLTIRSKCKILKNWEASVTESTVKHVLAKCKQIASLQNIHAILLRRISSSSFGQAEKRKETAYV